MVDDADLPDHDTESTSPSNDATWGERAHQAEARGYLGTGTARLLLHQVIDRMSDQDILGLWQLISSWVVKPDEGESHGGR